MKIKLVPVLTALLIAIMIISFFITQRSLKTLSSLPKETNDERPSDIQLPIESILPSKTPTSRAITIIKGPEVKEKVFTERKKPAPQTQEAETISTSPKLSSGIIKDGKQPTPEQIKEMNEKGIVIF